MMSTKKQNKTEKYIKGILFYVFVKFIVRYLVIVLIWAEFNSKTMKPAIFPSVKVIVHQNTFSIHVLAICHFSPLITFFFYIYYVTFSIFLCLSFVTCCHLLAITWVSQKNPTFLCHISCYLERATAFSCFVCHHCSPKRMKKMENRKTRGI